MLEIKVDSARALQALQRLAAASANLSPVMRILAGVMHDAVMENFAQQGRPRWAGLKHPSDKRKGGMILQDTGRLKNSIEQHADASSAMVGTNVKYAAIHQFGGKTKAHEIRPRLKKALAFGGRVVNKVNHPGSNIPARPFLKLGADDENKIVSKVSAYLQQAIG